MRNVLKDEIQEIMLEIWKRNYWSIS